MVFVYSSMLLRVICFEKVCVWCIFTRNPTFLLLACSPTLTWRLLNCTSRFYLFLLVAVVVIFYRLLLLVPSTHKSYSPFAISQAAVCFALGRLSCLFVESWELESGKQKMGQRGTDDLQGPSRLPSRIAMIYKGRPHTLPPIQDLVVRNQGYSLPWEKFPIQCFTGVSEHLEKQRAKNCAILTT